MTTRISQLIEDTLDHVEKQAVNAIKPRQIKNLVGLPEAGIGRSNEVFPVLTVALPIPAEMIDPVVKIC